MSADLIAFLKAWYDWATSGAPNCGPFDRSLGLCDNAAQTKWGLRVELTSMFREERSSGNMACHIYPFGESDFDARAKDHTFHECPKRLAWVRARLVEAGEIA